MPNLSADQVHLLWARTDTETDPASRARQLALLSAEEQARHIGFQSGRDRHQYLVSHALLRQALSLFAPVAPHAWQFARDAHGRPYIAGPAGHGSLRFSLSHTRGLAVVAVAQNVDVGVDVEAARPHPDLGGVAAAAFTAAEVAQLAARPELFYDIWTLKEAYVKARGLGLSLPLDSFSFNLADPTRPRLTCHSRCGDDAARWSFHLRRGAGYSLALAWAGPKTMHVVEREFVFSVDSTSAAVRPGARPALCLQPATAEEVCGA